MKSILSLLALLAAPVAAQACEGVGVVQSLGVVGVQSHCAPVGVQSHVQAFEVAQQNVEVRTLNVPVVQTFHVPTVFTFQSHGAVVLNQGVVVQAQAKHCGGGGGFVANALGALRPNRGNVTKIKIK